MYLCSFPDCYQSFDSDKGRKRHESITHVGDGNECLGCHKTYNTVYGRNVHHKKCPKFKQYVASLQTGLPVNDKSSPDLLEELLDQMKQTGGVCSININNITNTNCNNTTTSNIVYMGNNATHSTSSTQDTTTNSTSSTYTERQARLERLKQIVQSKIRDTIHKRKKQRRQLHNDSNKFDPQVVSRVDTLQVQSPHEIDTKVVAEMTQFVESSIEDVLDDMYQEPEDFEDNKPAYVNAITNFVVGVCCTFLSGLL